MDAIKLSVEINEDRLLHLDINLPANTPLGRAEIIIQPYAEDEAPVANPDREAARAKLLAGGFLVTTIRVPDGTVPLSPQERMRLGTLPPGSPSIDDLINEDRGEV